MVRIYIYIYKYISSRFIYSKIKHAFLSRRIRRSLFLSEPVFHGCLHTFRYELLDESRMMVGILCVSGNDSCDS